jgi:hypothetical protein
MNNLFDIDNMDSMKGNTRTTTFNTNGSITEEIRDSVTNVLNARRLTTFPASGNVVETTTIYADDGKSVVRVTTVTTSFPTNTTMKEVVS